MLYQESEKLRLEREAMRRNHSNGRCYFNLFFLALIVFWIITFFTQDFFKTATFPLPSTFEQPKQYEIDNPQKFELEKDGYHYVVTPLFDYEVNGVVLSRYDYTLLSLRRTDAVFPIDLCLTWGENVKKGIFREDSFSARQDARWCYVDWTRRIDFNLNEFSNNHLLIVDPELEEKAFSIRGGDQVRIRGKLVDVQAKNIDGELGVYEFQSAKWKTSQSRKDSGGGACEVIYVEELEILQKGNELSFWGHLISGWLILIVIGFKFLEFFLGKIKR